MVAFRIAILECDIPAGSVREHRGSYGDCFRRLLVESLSTRPSDCSTVEPIFTSWDVVGSGRYPKPDDVDAYLLTGSKYNSFDDDKWIVELVTFVRDIYENKRKPIIGICFGHQIIGRATGAQVARNPKGWEVAVSQVDMDYEGRKLFGRDSLALHQMHQDVVLTIPPGLKNLGSSPSCGIQGLYRKNRVFCLQAHPEFDAFIMKEILEKRYEEGIFNVDIFQNGMERAGREHDGLRVAAAMWDFMLG